MMWVTATVTKDPLWSADDPDNRELQCWVNMELVQALKTNGDGTTRVYFGSATLDCIEPPAYFLSVLDQGAGSVPIERFKHLDSEHLT